MVTSAMLHGFSMLFSSFVKKARGYVFQVCVREIPSDFSEEEGLGASRKGVTRAGGERW